MKERKKHLWRHHAYLVIYSRDGHESLSVLIFVKYVHHIYVTVKLTGFLFFWCCHCTCKVLHYLVCVSSCSMFYHVKFQQWSFSVSRISNFVILQFKVIVGADKSYYWAREKPYRLLDISTIDQVLEYCIISFFDLLQRSDYTMKPKSVLLLFCLGFWSQDHKRILFRLVCQEKLSFLVCPLSKILTSVTLGLHTFYK